MIKLIDDFLNSITMYKAVMYGLILLVVSSLIASLMGAIPFSTLSLLTSLLILTITCYLTNLAFAKVLNAPVNSESYLITALILFFIMTPSIDSYAKVALLVLVASIAMASKYLLVYRKRHIFNPVAISAVIITIIGASASWWVATPVLFPAVLIIGLLIIRKIRKFSMVFAFIAVACIEMVIFSFLYGTSPITTLNQFFFSWPVLFFAAFMLTEPLTTPPTRQVQVLYGVLVGFLFAFQLPLGPIKLTPELALVIGNVFSYIMSSKQRIMITLKAKEKLAPNIYNFIFQPNKKPKFSAGQYMEWTLPHKNVDSRGNRRFFTLASSPTEEEVILGVRIEEDSSSYKKALLNMEEGKSLSIGNLKGDFTLPEDKNEKLVFLAGGIGITPFRGIIKYLLDKNEKRDIVLMHACSTYGDFVYQDVFNEAKEKIGLKIVCILSDNARKPENYEGHSGHFNAEILKSEVNDYKERTFYISGSSKMVDIYKKILSDAGVRDSQIITDYFSGY